MRELLLPEAKMTYGAYHHSTPLSDVSDYDVVKWAITAWGAWIGMQTGKEIITSTALVIQGLNFGKGLGGFMGLICGGVGGFFLSHFTLQHIIDPINN